MTYNPQHTRIRNLLLSPKQQAVYGTALADAALTIRPRFPGDAFVEINPDYFSDEDLSGKGHDFPTVRDEIARETGLALSLPLTNDLAGWCGAFMFGQESVSGSE